MRTAFKTSFCGIKHALEFNKGNDEEPDDDEAHYSLENEQNASHEGTLQLFSKE